MYAGLGIGFLAFLGIGLVPGLLYGGYIGLIMAGSIFGMPVEPTLVARLLTGGGMGLGALMALTFFLVVGSLVGTVTGFAIAAVKENRAKSIAALEAVQVKQRIP
ncbi:MAG: hypothetical protein A2X86_16735 [Bdellovibrionales bacterium GWA2_49_15]|nr:MAG: hypothetical protein A2X86_16735 [Bdellovibrionales bacterium GWA2_49_15]